MVVDSAEWKLKSKSSTGSSSGSLFFPEHMQYWDGEQELPARDAAVTTAALCCQTGREEDHGPATLDWKMGTRTTNHCHSTLLDLRSSHLSVPVTCSPASFLDYSVLEVWSIQCPVQGTLGVPIIFKIIFTHTVIQIFKLSSLVLPRN